MTYEEQAMDAGYDGEEAEELARMLEYEDMRAMEEHYKEQQEMEEEWERLQREAVEEQ